MTEMSDETRDGWTDRLSEYLDGELAPPEKAALEEHLRTCVGCRAVLEDLRRVKRFAAELKDAPPRNELWGDVAKRIGHPEAAVLVADELAARRRLRFGPWLKVGAAAAAVLVLGVALGRWTAPGTPTLPTAQVEAPAPGTPLGSDAYRVAAVEHLGRTETLLATFRADARDGRTDQQVAAWADGLLANTRLLLDSPAADDPRLRALLEDMELVLVQIAQLPRQGAGGAEVEIARDALEESRLLPRMRTLVPAGPVTPSTLGES
jgi:putative zinc finger protein